jgi:hypothetical protein
MAEDTRREHEFDRPFDPRFDRSGRGFPNFGYRLRQIEKRLAALEQKVETKSGAQSVEYAEREKTDERARG